MKNALHGVLTVLMCTYVQRTHSNVPQKVISILAIPGLFTQTPVSVNSTPSAIVHFACSVERGIPFWHIDGLALWQLPSSESFHSNNTQLQDGGHSSALYILVPEIYNNSLIQCIVNTAQGEIESAPVVLKVQGQSYDI